MWSKVSPLFNFSNISLSIGYIFGVVANGRRVLSLMTSLISSISTTDLTLIFRESGYSKLVSSEFKILYPNFDTSEHRKDREGLSSILFSTFLNSSLNSSTFFSSGILMTTCLEKETFSSKVTKHVFK
ncbi:hypothetical protein ACOJUR_12365 [Alicyclobacillus tolerans]